MIFSRKKIKIMGIDYKIVEVKPETLKEILGVYGDKKVERISTHWDPGDAVIYVLDDLNPQVKERDLFTQILQVISFYLGFEFWKNENVIRPFANAIYDMLYSLQDHKNNNGGVKDNTRLVYIR